MSASQSERTPLLAAAGGNPGRSGDEEHPALKPFYYATMAAIGTGAITMIFLVTSMAIMSGRPRDYYPPYELSYNFGSTAGLSIVALIHSGLMLMALRQGSPPPQGWSGILVDILAGISLLFQSLYGMQQFLYPNTYYGTVYGCREPYNKSRPVDPDCEPWARRAEPVFWCYLFFMLTFGTSHVVLLFLRASMFKRKEKVLRVRLIGQDRSEVSA